MPTSPEDFLLSAESYITSKSEVDFRNSISRAYYAMYHKVLSTITQDVPKYTSGGVHHCLVAHLQNNANGEPFDRKIMKRISYMVKSAHVNRCEADYNISDLDIKFINAEDSLTTAKSVFDLCDGLMNAQTFNTIKIAQQD